MHTSPFPIGKKVLCTNGRFSTAVFEFFQQVPQEGCIYTVNDLFWGTEDGSGDAVLSVRLAELPPLDSGRCGFSLWRFRLLEDLEELEACREPLALSA